ncbi:MAG: hypothetical protein LBD99_00815 [Candidatus Margulisbacteria bacterium]|nr:hypothetical protein [Candidatus Margulisiibacteriota bacterium]
MLKSFSDRRSPVSEERFFAEYPELAQAVTEARDRLTPEELIEAQNIRRIDKVVYNFSNLALFKQSIRHYYENKTGSRRVTDYLLALEILTRAAFLTYGEILD